MTGVLRSEKQRQREVGGVVGDFPVRGCQNHTFENFMKTNKQEKQPTGRKQQTCRLIEQGEALTQNQ